MGHILLKRYRQNMANGDRSTSTIPCHRYELVLVDKAANKEIVVQEGNDYDYFHCHVDSKCEDYKQMKRAGEDMALFFGVDFVVAEYARQVVTKESWIQVVEGESDA